MHSRRRMCHHPRTRLPGAVGPHQLPSGHREPPYGDGAANDITLPHHRRHTARLSSTRTHGAYSGTLSPSSNPDIQTHCTLHTAHCTLHAARCTTAYRSIIFVGLQLLAFQSKRTSTATTQHAVVNSVDCDTKNSSFRSAHEMVLVPSGSICLRQGDEIARR